MEIQTAKFMDIYASCGSVNLDDIRRFFNISIKCCCPKQSIQNQQIKCALNEKIIMLLTKGILTL